MTEALEKDVKRPDVPKKATRKHPDRITNLVKNMTPEERSEHMRQLVYKRRDKQGHWGRIAGVPRDWTKEEAEVYLAGKKPEVKRIISIMSKHGMLPEDEMAKEALTTAVSVMHTATQFDTKLRAARLILDFSKARPAAKHELTVTRAEQFLADLVDAEENESRGST